MTVGPDRPYLGLCPNCRADEVIRLPGDMYSAILISAFRKLPVARLVCLNCGLVRDWIDDRRHLEMLRKRYGDQLPR